MARNGKNGAAGKVKFPPLRGTKKRTRETAQVEKVLCEHFPDHPPKYPPRAYRYNPASIRVRVVDPRFKGKSFFERLDMVRPVLKENLPEETWWDIMVILCLAPDEVKEAPANRLFEKAIPF